MTMDFLASDGLLVISDLFCQINVNLYDKLEQRMADVERKEEEASVKR